MEMLEGLDDRALAIDGANLQILRWGAEQDRIPLVSLEPAQDRPRRQDASCSAPTRSGSGSASAP